MGRTELLLTEKEVVAERRFWRETSFAASTVGGILIGLGSFFFGQQVAQDMDTPPPVVYHGTEAQMEHAQEVNTIEGLLPEAAVVGLGALMLGGAQKARKRENHYADIIAASVKGYRQAGK